MIIRTQANQLIDMSGCMVRRVDQPLPSILLLSVRDAVEGVGSLMLYNGTTAEADAKFAALIAAVLAEDTYFSMI